MRGRFVVLEGVDGSGKSTQAERLVGHLAAAGRPPLHVREPGATPVGERLRTLLLDADAESRDPRTEALLFFAARSELLAAEIAPALMAGQDVVCDRFTPSTLAYQGQTPELAEFVLALDSLVVPEELQPDLVLLLDLDPEESLARAGKRGAPDGFEQRGLDFARRVRAGYHHYAELRPHHARLIDVTGLDPDAVAACIAERMQEVLS